MPEPRESITDPQSETATSASGRQLEGDPLDEFEPLPVPEERLWMLARLSFLMVFSVVIPISRGKMLLFIVFNVEQAELKPIVGVFFFAPAIAALIAGIIGLQLTRAPTTFVVPRGTGILSAVVFSLSVMWVAALTHVLTSFSPPSFRVWICMAGAYCCSLPGVVALVRARIGPGRGVVAVISAASLNLGLFWIILIMEGPHILFPLFWIPVAAAIAAIAFGFSCVLVYRRQGKLEKSFQQAMLERERERRG